MLTSKRIETLLRKMQKIEIFLIILLSLAIASRSLGNERIECRWSAEYLCGDKCLKISELCRCGNDIIKFNDAYDFSCCNQGECIRDEYIGNVYCPDGLKQSWEEQCHGRCKQYAKYGHSTMSCEDQRQCVKELILCRGHPLCDE